jgi:ATP-binding cassette subfamily B protein
MRKLPLGYFGKRDLADLTETIMGDVNRLEHVWSHCLGYLYGSYISTAIVAVMLFAFDWRLAIACLWGVPIAFILLFGSRKINKKYSEIAKAAGVQVADGIQETLENVREIRATNQESKFLGELDAKIDHHEKTMIAGELACGIFVNAASVIMRLGVATTILTGTSLILSGQVDFMVLFMFLLVITRVYAPFDQALALIAEMFMSQISASRLMEIHDTKTADGDDAFRPGGHDIIFENVGFAYDNEQVLRGVSFTAKEGEVTALVGPSGSGKSTCARLAARLWDINQGTIKVGGVDIASVDPEVLLGDYSMVFQDVVLFDDTVMENIRLGKHGATDEEVMAAAKAANCDEFVEKLPQGYNTTIGENGAKLSGGERQRISIARALLKNAPIVLLDEATASLDVENETKVQGALSRLLEGKTVLVIAHRMRTVEAADKIVVLSEGKVAEEGTPAELMSKENGIFRHMAQLQSDSAEWRIA